MLETVMIHHVSEEVGARVGPRAEYTIPPDALDAYLQSRDAWAPVSAPDDLKTIHAGKRYLVTFDDGYRNNLTQALPVLERHETPCLLFVTTGFIDGTLYPYELELASVIEEADVLDIPDLARRTSLHDLTDRSSLYRSLRRPLKQKRHEARESFMERLADQNGYDRADVQDEPILNWDEVCELSDHPLVTIGVHTRSHVVLPRQPWSVVYQELRHSKRRLESQTGKPVEYLSYPYGSSSLVVRQMARWLGIRYGFTTQSRRADRLNIWNRLSIPRIDISDVIDGD